MSVIKVVTKPLRFIKARAITVRNGIQGRKEVREGEGLGAQANRVPIFILGSPRSGTTLLYQLLVENFNVGYLSNLHAKNYSRIVQTEKDLPQQESRINSDFESEHGATKGDTGPSEAGDFWYRFFPKYPHQMSSSDATKKRIKELRSVIRLFADTCKKPVVFKNVFNSLRIPVLVKAIPEARYILIERDLTDNARSLLVGRIKRGDINAWWSAKPEGFDAVISKRPAYQAVWQSAQMNKIAKAELSKLEKDKYFTLTYAEVCANPEKALKDIHSWLLDSGVEIDRRKNVSPPVSFEHRQGGLLDQDIECELVKAVLEVSQEKQLL